MNDLKIFKNKEFGEVRTVTINNEVWFVGKDVADSLGYQNGSKAVLTHVDDEDKDFIMLDIADSQNGNVPLGQSKTAIINESGLYSLVLSSKLPNAKKFKRWITSEVLPSIRKTGNYSIESQRPQGKELLALAVLEAQKVIEEQTLQIEEMKPKADYHDEVLNKKNLIATTIIAKDLGFTSAIKLNRYLHDRGIIYKNQSGIWCPYAKYEWLIVDGYADYQSCSIEGSLPTLKWTEKGRKWIVNMCKNEIVL